MKAALLTTIYDGYDALQPICPQVGIEVEWVCVTDGLDNKAAEGYKLICHPRPELDSYRASKYPKCLPWEYTNAEASVYIDASFAVTSSTFVRDALALADPIAQFIHPWRDCAFLEAEECLQLPKYVNQADLIRAQVAQYESEGHPRNWGLWASGCIARYHTAQVREFGEAWLADILTYSHQCQISEPPRLRGAGLRPDPLTGDHLGNPWLAYRASPRH